MPAILPRRSDGSWQPDSLIVKRADTGSSATDPAMRGAQELELGHLILHKDISATKIDKKTLTFAAEINNLLAYAVSPGN